MACAPGKARGRDVGHGFRFGVNTLIWTENFSEQDLWILPRIRQLGFQAIDLSVARPEEFPVEATRRVLGETGVEPVITTALSPQHNPVSPESGVRRSAVENLKRIVDIANTLKVKIVGGVIYAAWGYKTNRPPTEQEWQWSLECLREVARYARESGEVVLAVEVINRYVTHFLNIAEDAVRYCRETGMGNVKVHLDSFHMMIEEESFAKAIRCCGREYLAYFHTCESHRGIPGTGLVPWRETFDTLREVGYDSPLVIESYDPKFVRAACNSCIWRSFASSGEELAVKGLQFFQKVLEKEGEAAS
jgi:D-psicose/D-tagatose/L-ribulose 3-epimerase